MSKPTLRHPRLDLNPSSADRWTKCTASPKFIMDHWDKLPPEDKTFADPGTTAHEVAAAMLESREPNLSECPVPVDEDMRWHGWNYMEYVEGLKEKGARIVVEQKFPLWYMPGRNAKIDVAVVNPESLHIVDYKYGEGIPVSPVENLQGSIYARSVVTAMDQGKLEPDLPAFIHIYQPRGRENGGAHTWETTWGELLEFTQVYVDTPAQAIQRKDGTLVFAPSEKACQWCPAKGFCDARREFFAKDVKALAVIDGETHHLPPAQTLSVSQIVAIVRHRKEIEKWFGDVVDYATLTKMATPAALPGLKMVMWNGGKRYWTDPKEAKKLLLETILKPHEVVDEKVISPAAAEKLLGKGKFSVDLTNLIAKPAGVPVIAPEDDKREAIGSVDPTTIFENVEDQ